MIYKSGGVESGDDGDDEQSWGWGNEESSNGE
jgi:hypothetical protein